jgi:hypothetical protein
LAILGFYLKKKKEKKKEEEEEEGRMEIEGGWSHPLRTVWDGRSHP